MGPKVKHSSCQQGTAQGTDSEVAALSHSQRLLISSGVFYLRKLHLGLTRPLALA